MLFLSCVNTIMLQPEEDIGSFVDSLPPVDHIRNRVNLRFDQMFTQNVSGGAFKPLVCTVCDTFLLDKDAVNIVPLDRMKKCHDILSWSWLDDKDRIPELEASFRFVDDVPGLRDRSWLNEMGLSPRGSFIQVSAQKKGFTCCECCFKSLNKKSPEVPYYALVNNNHSGSPPQCLTDLTEAELAFLSPVHAYSYCYVYEGGRMKNMNGTLVFMRVTERQMARAITTLDCMGLKKHVVFLLSGKMTYEQKKKVETKTRIRTDKMIAAVEWLCANNRMWKDIDLEKIRKEIGDCKPILVDKSTEVGSGNANVEEEEIFTCYFPDGTMDSHAGGFDSPGAFKEFVKEMQEKNFDIEMKANLEKEFVKGGDDELLLGASLLQFPYGVGGLDETRQKPKGKLTTKSVLDEYLCNLSKRAAPEFQMPLFQLIMYSLKSKARLLNQSRLQLRNKTDAENIAEGFTAEDLSQAIRGRRMNERNKGSYVSRKVLDAVDAVSKSLPHTKDAAKKARGVIEAMMHHFGMGSVFLTVTPDDENSIIMQIFAGVTIDDDRDIMDLTDEELTKRAQARESIRFDFPGAAALGFEAVLSILFEEVIGWDRKENCRNGRMGLFGDVEALVYAVEEQGRKTLHCHIILWIRGYRELQKVVFFGNEAERKVAIRKLQKYHDHLASTRLFPIKQGPVKQAFEHSCEVQLQRDRGIPDVVSLQELRWLRYKEGGKEVNYLFATCPHCNKTWTYEELINDYCLNGLDIVDKVSMITDEEEEQYEVSRARMLGHIVHYQAYGEELEDCPEACINIIRNSHISCHAKGCFRCSKLKGRDKKDHVCGKNCECRYRMPDLARKYTTVKFEKDSIPWFAWTGEEKSQPLIQILPKRSRYDLFQNVCCTAVSLSKFSCNTNVSLITDGPIGYYIAKYCVKPNDKDEVSEYAEVDASMKKMSTESVHDNHRSEALRIICRAAFAHNKANIISGPMASFLTRNNSRFYYSHEFVFCPVIDVVRLHNHQDISGVLNVTPTGETYLENQALHYLCRPDTTDSVSLLDFTERYVSGNVTKRKNDDNPVVPFIADTTFFKHPSVRKGKKKQPMDTCSQGVKFRDSPVLAKVPQWVFPDTADFHGNVLTCEESKITRAMNTYAQYVLTLLLPHRSSADLKGTGNSEFKYALKLRDVFDADEYRKQIGEEPIVFTQRNVSFLQNLQDSARNCIRYKIKSDDLQSQTEPYRPDGDDINDNDSDSDDEDNIEDVAYEDFLASLGSEYTAPPHDTESEYFIPSMKNLKFKHIRSKGDWGCGFSDDISPPLLEVPETPFLEVRNTSDPSTTGAQQNVPDEERRSYSIKDIVQVLLRRSTVSQKDVWQDKSIEVSDANGSVRSIREWSVKGFGSDRKQQRAFEAIISAFLLTFYDEDGATREDTVNATITREERIKYRRAKRALFKLKGNKDAQLIALLHGPGGSGKSTVINMVKAYAKSYCESLGHPYTHRTIVTTALTGVAATLLHGETTHLALGMNRDSIPEAMRKEFQDTRLVIVDEISFAGPEDFERMHDCLKTLMSRRYKLYGGVNMVFAGDYSQLEPVASKGKVYNEENLCVFHNAINCFVELDGRHRFRDDPAWGDRLFRFRQGVPTLQDIRFINDNCHISKKKVPPRLQVATYFNRNRDAINAAIFERWCEDNRPQDGTVLEHACVIFMDDLEMTNSKKSYVPIKSNQLKRHFFEHCSENDCKMSKSSRGRVDNMLKLYPNCPVMFTKNEDVLNGQANGSRLTVQGVKLKAGEQPSVLKLDCGTSIYALNANQVESIRVKQESQDISPQFFDVTPHSFTFTCKLQIGTEEHLVRMKGKQFPIISNSCTTGHKLQGCTVEEILINDFNYAVNGPYVVLSRVKTMAGLYLRQHLSMDLDKYRMSNNMLKMLQAFRGRCLLNELLDEEYENIFTDIDGELE